MALKKCCAHNWQQELIAYLWVMNIIICITTSSLWDRYRSFCTFQEYKWKYKVDTRPFRPLVQSVKGRLRQTSSAANSVESPSVLKCHHFRIFSLISGFFFVRCLALSFDIPAAVGSKSEAVAGALARPCFGVPIQNFLSLPSYV